MFKGVFWEHLIIGCYITCGKPIIGTTDPFNNFIKCATGNILRTSEKEMFKKVGKTGLPRHFSAGTDVIHNSIRNYRIRMIGMQYYLKAIWHYVFLIVYFQCICLWSLGTCSADHN